MNTGPRLWASVLLLGAFITGAVFGGTVSNAWGDPDEDGGRHERGSFTEMLAEELDLTEEQSDTIEVILESSRPEMCAIWEEYQPRFESIRESIGVRIRTVLTEEQLVDYENWLDHVDSVKSARHNERRAEGRNGC